MKQIITTFLLALIAFVSHGAAIPVPIIMNNSDKPMDPMFLLAIYAAFNTILIIWFIVRWLFVNGDNLSLTKQFFYNEDNHFNDPTMGLIIINGLFVLIVVLGAITAFFFNLFT